MLLSTLLLALPLSLAAPAPNPDLMDFWPTHLIPTGTAETTMTYVFNFPFPTTVTRTWGAAAAAPTGTGAAASGTAMAANAAASPTSGGSLWPGILDPGAMAGAFQAQADALLAEVKKQTITIVCAILFGTLGGLALIGGVSLKTRNEGGEA